MLTCCTLCDKKRVCAAMDTQTKDLTLCAIECGFSAITERIGQESRFLYVRDAGITRRVRNSKVPPSAGRTTTPLMQSLGNIDRAGLRTIEGVPEDSQPRDVLSRYPLCKLETVGTPAGAPNEIQRLFSEGDHEPIEAIPLEISSQLDLV